MRHFLSVSDYSPDEVQNLLDLAIKLKKEYFSGGNPPHLKGKVLGMIFQKPSWMLLTRIYRSSEPTSMKSMQWRLIHPLQNKNTMTQGPQLQVQGPCRPRNMSKLRHTLRMPKIISMMVSSCCLSIGKYNLKYDLSNNVFGEYDHHAEMIDKMDLYADINIGRIPCTNYIDLNIVIGKIINYEN
jgi:hypothetical protein